MRRFVITAALQEGSVEKVREILREGPPFDISATGLARHEVFLADDEIVFMFEGTHAEEEVRRLFSSRHLLSRAGRIGVHLGGKLRMPREVFTWERPAELDGVAFVAQPGPGYSEGGPVE